MLCGSLAVDGGILVVTARELAERAQRETPDLFAKSRLRAIAHHLRHSSDPFLVAVAAEDAAAVSGVLIAAAATAAARYTGIAAFDGAGSIVIGTMLLAAAGFLMRLNAQYLLGRSVGRGTAVAIADIIRRHPSVEAVREVHTQWLSPTTFQVSAKVDFDGAALSARLRHVYAGLALASKDPPHELPLLLAMYAEDVTRVVEAEVRAIEAEVRAAHPAAVWIELEPGGRDSEAGVYFARRLHEAAGGAAAGAPGAAAPSGPAGGGSWSAAAPEVPAPTAAATAVVCTSDVSLGANEDAAAAEMVSQQEQLIRRLQERKAAATQAPAPGVATQPHPR